MGKYEQLASEIVKHVGGRENISSLTHCITRLRFRRPVWAGRRMRIVRQRKIRLEESLWIFLLIRFLEFFSRYLES